MTVPRQRQASSLAAPAARPVEHHTAGRFILRTLFWSGLALAVLPWWLGTKAGSIETSADVFQAAGRVTGLIAGYLLLTQVILMSRLGFLERWIGARHLGLWHRELGGSVLVMILAHGALITVGYAYADSKTATSELGVLLTQYDDMVTAFIAAGMLVCIGLLSIRRLRRALPYELWYFLHLTSYLALLLGFAHQFSDGQELYKPGLGRTAWIGFYVVTIAAVVLGRIVGPLWLNLRHRLRVADVVAEGPNMVSIYITGARLHDLDAKAGQFFRWRFLGRGLWWQAHPFSLSAAPNGRWLRLTVKTVGDHTQRLRAMRPGTRIFVEGPWGDFTAARRIKQRALLIAAGSGIGPIRALLEELPPGAIVIYRASAVHDLHLRHELEQLSELRHAQLWFVVGDRRAPGPRRLFTPAGLRDLVPDVTERDVYLCGPDGLIQQSLAVLRRLRVPRRQVHLDPFEF
ncbi:ferric reductase-like transmembrane domain-containing protein [Dactylosporangium vinaceum]|uniref:Ferric reductase-like transmembrane domain-containing protein n=1 Tax=Dactylosporangium vinaceum TaxID=53362 RepID=A0ABV5M6B4_9ACTN|nr:ferric reductase-like transmembrane domain-containing protein [Dactylosporangium vinaceum]UAB97820.1 ferric reductase-like transmembrane domain-containing protein [Dactylosporangium vinaceum]